MTPVRVSVEAIRGCGYREEGGLYLVAPALEAPCGGLPVPLAVCPTCGTGVKPSRGWTWVDAGILVSVGERCVHHERRAGDPCVTVKGCAVAGLPWPGAGGRRRCGLLWIGAEHYPSASHFLLEADRLGVSRRIPALPRDFQLGVTWVLLAHRVAWVDGEDGPGVVAAFRPTAVERVVSESEAENETAMQQLRARGIEPVRVRPA